MLNHGVDSARLENSYQELKNIAQHCIGYPSNHDWDYPELFRFLDFPLNNIGDPFQKGIYPLNTLDYEREVIDTFGYLAGAKDGEFWGYVTAGGTEGNMYGLYLARELYPDSTVYFSEESHYSVVKILRLQTTSNIMLRATDNGEMDYQDLYESLKINPDSPPIIFANIGTTMKGAIDDIHRIKDILKQLGISKYYIHADCALHGLALPFIDNPPAWNFTDGVDSLSISGHKWLGSPVPCGIALAKKSHVDQIARSVEYIGMQDTTIAGSRSAFSPLILWYALRKKGYAGLHAMINQCLSITQFAVEQFQQRGIEAWANKNSPIVVFPRPSDKIIYRWSLAPDKDIAHIICMPQISEELLLTFIEEYCADQQTTTQKL